jgi:HSP20 family protein
MRGSIWDEIRRIQQRMDSMFEEFFREDPFYWTQKPLIEGSSKVDKGKELEKSRLYTPLTDIWDAGKEIKAEIDMPGLQKEDIKISAHKGVLEVKAEKKHESKEEKKGMYRFERSYQGFYRAYHLPPEADIENISAKYENGVLKISMPKKSLPDSKPKLIEVK